MKGIKFKPNLRGIVLPEHEPPILHEDVMQMSFENCYRIRKTYKEIIGLNGISHFSINIVDPNEKMSIISLNPHIAYNICADGSYLYNGSISPTYYRNQDIYTWDECYDNRFSQVLKNNMERKNGIEKGIVIIKRLGDFTLLYSFATTGDAQVFSDGLHEDIKQFYNMGDHCYSLIQGIYERYVDGFNVPKAGDLHLIKGLGISSRVVKKPTLNIIPGGANE